MLRHTFQGNPFGGAHSIFHAKPDDSSGGGGRNKSKKKKDEDEDDSSSDDDEEDDADDAGDDASDSESDDADDDAADDESDDSADDDEADTEDDKKGKKAKAAKSKTVTTKDMNRAIEKARKDEKTKLFDKIETLRTENDRLKRENTENGKRLSKIEGSLAAYKEAKDKNGKTIDTEKLLDSAHKKWDESRSRTDDKETKKLRKELDALRAENKASKLEKLRDVLIDEAGGEDSMITELVSGETEDEILESIDEAKAAFKRIAQKVKGKGKGSRSDADDDDDSDDDTANEDDDDADEESDADDEGDNDTRSSRKPKKRNESARRAPRELPDRSSGRRVEGSKSTVRRALSTVKRMSPEEYSANRTKLLGQVHSAYGRGAKPFGTTRSGSARNR